MKVTAILLAAGAGRRMRNRVPKALIKINGKPLFLHSLDAIKGLRAVTEIIITLPRSLGLDRIQRIASRFHGHKSIKVVAGGKERYDSVKTALSISNAPDFVLIHDCARPLITNQFVEKMLKSAFRNGSCVAGRILNESIKKLRGNLLVKNLPRDGIFIAETPQIFRTDTFIKCMRKLRADSKAVTDDSFIPLSMGLRVHYMITDFLNLKITTANDLRLARLLLKAH